MDDSYLGMIGAEVAGSYSPDRFFVTLSKGNQVEGEDGRMSLNPTVLHEYLHFLHNVSTICGLRTFSATFDLWRRFRAIVGPDGLSRGSSGTASEEGKSIYDVIRLADNMLGDGWVPTNGSARSVSVYDMEVQTSLHPLCGETAQATSVRLKLNVQLLGGGTEKLVFRFGLLAILEGLASEIERFPFSLPPVPPLPYRVLRAVGEHLAPQIGREFLLKIALLALQTNDPAGVLVELVKRFAAARATGKDADAAVAQVYADVRPCIIDFHAAAMCDLETLFTCLPSTTILAKGMGTVIGHFRTFLQKRASEPWFDLGLFAVNELGQVAADLIAGAPCLILQGKSGGSEPGRDQLVVWGNEELDALAVLQCAFHFMLSHRSSTGFLSTVQAERQDASPCPFASACTLKLRKIAPDICLKRPWRSSSWPSWGGEFSCWYGLGVSSTVGGAS